MSLKIFKKLLKQEHNLRVSKYTLWRLLHSFGYRYKKISGENRSVLCEGPDIVRLRNNFLRVIKKREEGFEPVYLDETWVNASHTASSQWVPDGDDKRSRRKLPLEKGERLIILSGGCSSKGFLPGCDLVFRAKSTDNTDYHSEMNGTVFLDWIKNKLVPALPEKSFVVMDNAPYHSVQDPDSKAPTEKSRKGYANEVGESFRALIHVYWVRLSYLTASGYVVADSIHKGYVTSQKSFSKPAEKNTHVSLSVGDTLLWQGLASVAIPGFTINRICKLTGLVLKRTSRLPSPMRKWTTTAIGLACIPFIVSPIDRSVDHLMDKFVRPYYPVQMISGVEENGTASKS